MKIIAEVTDQRGRRYLVGVAPNGTVWERIAPGQGLRRRYWHQAGYGLQVTVAR